MNKIEAKADGDNGSQNRSPLDIQQTLFENRRSPLRTYQDLAVGRRGLGALLCYEFMQTFVCGFPGAAGLALRRLLYRRWLGRVGRNVTFGAHVTIRHPHKIRIGDNVVIDDYCMLDAKGTENSGIEIGSNVVISRQCMLQCKNGDIRIGDGANIGARSIIASSNLVTVGPRTLVAAYAFVVGGGHEYARPDIPVMDQERVGQGIRIGAESWIGAHAVVLDGVEVGQGTIVGAGAIVTKSLPEQAIAAGVPARVIRLRQEPGA